MIRSALHSLRARWIEAARLMIGLPDYERYCRHMQRRHLDREPMSRVAFFRNRQLNRYAGRGGGKCC